MVLEGGTWAWPLEEVGQYRFEAREPTPQLRDPQYGANPSADPLDLW